MTEMQTQTNINDHNVWCGQHSQGISHGLQGDEVQNEQTTLVPQQLYIPTSQSEFTASYSDDLFRPVRGGSVLHSYTLPDIPFNPHPQYNAYNRQTYVLQSSRPLPSTSYNNPSFAIPHFLTMEHTLHHIHFMTHPLIHWECHHLFLYIHIFITIN